jgi:hypothetical protein
MTLQVDVGLLNRFAMVGTYMIRTIHARRKRIISASGTPTRDQDPRPHRIRPTTNGAAPPSTARVGLIREFSAQRGFRDD